MFAKKILLWTVNNSESIDLTLGSHTKGNFGCQFLLTVEESDLKKRKKKENKTEHTMYV